MNGDGKDDIVAFGNKAVYVSLSSGSSFGAPCVWINSFGPAAGGWTSFNTYPRYATDVNGDGKADIMAFGNRAVYVALSTGGSFGSARVWTYSYGPSAGGWSEQNLYPRFPGDVNGDGKADAVGYGYLETFATTSP